MKRYRKNLRGMKIVSRILVHSGAPNAQRSRNNVTNSEGSNENVAQIISQVPPDQVNLPNVKQYITHVGLILEIYPQLGDLVIAKGLQVCHGWETKLLACKTFNITIKETFGEYRDAAMQFLNAYLKESRSKQVRLLFIDGVSTVLGAFIKILSPADDEQVLANLVDIVYEKWDVLIRNMNASLFVRRLMGKLSNYMGDTSETQPPPSFSERPFKNLIRRAINYEYVKENACPALLNLVSSVIPYYWETHHCLIWNFLEAALNEPDDVIEQCTDPYWAMIWTTAAQLGDNKEQTKFHETVLKGRLYEIVESHPTRDIAEAFTRYAKSSELQNALFDEYQRFFAKLFYCNCWRIVVELIKNGDHRRRKYVIDEVKKYYKCNKKEDEKNFFAKSIPAVPSHQPGWHMWSILIKEMCVVEEGEFVIDSIHGLPKEDLIDLSLSEHGSAILRTILKSNTVTVQKKMLIAKPLKENWKVLLINKNGSYIFECMWNHRLITMEEKVKIMVEMDEIPREMRTKSMRYMVKNLGVYRFRTNKKEWMMEEEAWLALCEVKQIPLLYRVLNITSPFPAGLHVPPNKF